MATKEKWVELFEQVVGRKPSAEEFLVAKNGNFDLKQIKSIAGLVETSEVSQFTQEDCTTEVPTSPVTQVAEPVVAPVVQSVPAVVQPSSSLQQSVPQQQAKVKPILTKKQKLTRIGLGIGALVILGLGGGYYYLDKQTGPEVAVEEFTQSLQTNDYDQMAKLLSTKENKWTKDEAKGFIAYFDDNEIDLKSVLENLAQNKGENVYNDERGNKLIGLKQTSKKLGIFPEYQVTTYPIELSVTSNLSELTVDGQKIEKDKETSLGEVKFAPKAMAVSAKTDLGDLKTNVNLDLNTIENNQAKITMVTTDKKIVVKLEEELTDIEKIKLVINGKEASDDLTANVSLLDNQDITVYATFSYEGKDYTTEKTETSTGSKKDVSVVLNLSSDVKKQVEEAKKAKAAKDEAAKQAAEAEKEKARQLEATKDKAYNFLVAYRKAVYDSIKNRTNTYESYYDVNSSVYQSMVAYTVGGGANAKKVDYLSAGDFTVTDFKAIDNSSYEVTMHNTFTEYYFSGKSDFVEKTQTFYIRTDGDSFKIYEISERIIQ